jgi:hypothetical protein
VAVRRSWMAGTGLVRYSAELVCCRMDRSDFHALFEVARLVQDPIRSITLEMRRKALSSHLHLISSFNVKKNSDDLERVSIGLYFFWPLHQWRECRFCRSLHPYYALLFQTQGTIDS